VGFATDELVWSDEVFRLFGLRPFKPTEPRFMEFVHPDDRDRVNRAPHWP